MMRGGSGQDGVLGCLKWEWERSSHDESKDVYRDLLTEPSAPTENFRGVGSEEAKPQVS